MRTKAVHCHSELARPANLCLVGYHMESKSRFLGPTESVGLQHDNFQGFSASCLVLNLDFDLGAQEFTRKSRALGQLLNHVLEVRTF